MDRFIEEFQPPETDIALCGSMAHQSEMRKLVEQLQNMGYTVSTPDFDAEPVDYELINEPAEISGIKGRFIRRHFANIARSKCLLIANYEKNGIEGYVGGNTLLEMCAGFVCGLPIYVLNPISKQKNYEEIFGLEPIVLNGDLSKLRSAQEKKNPRKDGTLKVKSSIDDTLNVVKKSKKVDNRDK